MASVDTLIALGFQAEQAKAISSGTRGTVTATGTTIADAAGLVADSTLVTGASSAGVQLPDKMGSIAVGITTADTIVYPHSSSGIINGGSAGAGYTVDVGDGAIFIRIDALNWIAIGTPAA